MPGLIGHDACVRVRGLLLLLLASFGAGLSSCGWPLPGDDGAGAQEGAAPSPVPGTLPQNLVVWSAEVPLETLLFSDTAVGFPLRFGGRSLTVNFRSNDPHATFLCAFTAKRQWAPCPERTRHTFSRLIHGESYEIYVVARAKDGRVDGTPAKVAFMSDRLSSDVGVRQTWGDDRQERQGREDSFAPPLAAVLPEGGQGREPDRGNRTLQLGTQAAVVAPTHMFLTSFASSKTAGGGLQVMWRTPTPQDLIATFTNPMLRLACAYNWARLETFGREQAPYCLASPTRDVFREVAGAAMPFNHVELVSARRTGAGEVSAQETILFAAFDSDRDEASDSLMRHEYCNGATWQTQVLVPSAFGATATGVNVPQRESMQVCQMFSGADQSWWWVGAMQSEIAPGQRVNMVYSVRADLGVYGWPQLIERFQNVARQSVVVNGPGFSGAP